MQAGASLSYVDNGDGTITDTNTGLMWEKLSDDDSIHDEHNVYNWDDAFNVKVAALNAATFAGHSDWRLPNVKELQSIVDYSVPLPGPSVSSAFDSGCTDGCSVTLCSCTRAGVPGYWSSTSYASNTATFAWAVSSSESLTTYVAKLSMLSVRAVRGGL